MARRGQIYEGRGWRERVRVRGSRGGWGGKRRNRELCVELIRASLKVSRSKFPLPASAPCSLSRRATLISPLAVSLSLAGLARFPILRIGSAGPARVSPLKSLLVRLNTTKRLGPMQTNRLGIGPRIVRPRIKDIPHSLLPSSLFLLPWVAPFCYFIVRHVLRLHVTRTMCVCSSYRCSFNPT